MTATPGDPDFDIRQVDLRSIPEDLCRLVHEFLDRMRRELVPEDPPITLEERVTGWRNRPGHVETESWLAFDAAGGVVAVGEGHYTTDTERNRHLLHFWIQVRPEARRRGLGRALLRRIVHSADQKQRTLLISGSIERVPAGAAFLAACGAEPRLESHSNELALDEVDPQLLQRWIDSAPQERFELGLWAGQYPEEMMPQIVVLWEIMNDAPRGRLDLDDSCYSEARLRATERMWLVTGHQRRTLYARERSSGRLAGFTEITWSRNHPELVSQGPTGVHVDFRGLGLGRWLKAEMVLLIRREAPAARRIRTGNADLNEPMLRINRQLGFKPHIASLTWQVGVEKARLFVTTS